jgi:hypothetical protein
MFELHHLATPRLQKWKLPNHRYCTNDTVLMPEKNHVLMARILLLVFADATGASSGLREGQVARILWLLITGNGLCVGQCKEAVAGQVQNYVRFTELECFIFIQSLHRISLHKIYTYLRSEIVFKSISDLLFIQWLSVD